MAFEHVDIPVDPYVVPAAQVVGAAYLERGEPAGVEGADNSYITDYFLWCMAELGDDRFVLFAAVDEDPEEWTSPDTFYRIVSASSTEGWAAETDWIPLPEEWPAISRMSAVPMGTNRVVAIIPRGTTESTARLLDFSSGSMVELDSIGGIANSRFDMVRCWKVGQDGVLVRSYSFSAAWLTSLRVVGDSLTQVATHRRTSNFANTVADPAWPNDNGVIPIGNKLLFLSQRYDYPDPSRTWFRVDVPRWQVWDFETLTVLHAFDLEPAYTVNRLSVGVALDDTSAFVFGNFYEWGPDPFSRSGSPGWIATVTLDEAGVATVTRHDGTNWPTRVEHPPNEVILNPSPWLDPRRGEQPQKGLFADWSEMFLVSPGVIAWVVQHGWASTDDNEKVVFYWSVAESALLGWAKLKGGRAQVNDTDPIGLHSSDSQFRDQNAVQLSDGSLLVSMNEYFAWETGDWPWTESILLYVVSVAAPSALGRPLGQRVRFT